MCEGSTPNPTVTMIASQGTVPYTFTFDKGTSLNQTLTTAGTDDNVKESLGTATVQTVSYKLKSVSYGAGTASDPKCSTTYTTTKDAAIEIKKNLAPVVVAPEVAEKEKLLAGKVMDP